MIEKTKLNYRAVDYLQILIIKYEELLHGLFWRIGMQLK